MTLARSAVAALGWIAVLLLHAEAQAEPPTSSAQPSEPAAPASPSQVQLPAPLPVAPAELSPPAKPPPAPVDTTVLTLTYGGFALAGLGVLVGSVSGIMALSKTSKLRSDCGGTVCPQSRQDDLSSAKNFAGLSTASFVVALVGVAAGVNGLILWGDSSPQQERQSGRLRVHPVVGLGAAGFEGSF